MGIAGPVWSAEDPSVDLQVVMPGRSHAPDWDQIALPPPV